MELINDDGIFFDQGNFDEFKNFDKINTVFLGPNFDHENNNMLLKRLNILGLQSIDVKNKSPETLKMLKNVKLTPKVLSCENLNDIYGSALEKEKDGRDGGRDGGRLASLLEFNKEEKFQHSMEKEAKKLEFSGKKESYKRFMTNSSKHSHNSSNSSNKKPVKFVNKKTNKKQPSSTDDNNN